MYLRASNRFVLVLRDIDFNWLERFLLWLTWEVMTWINLRYNDMNWIERLWLGLTWEILTWVDFLRRAKRPMDGALWKICSKQHTSGWWKSVICMFCGSAFNIHFKNTALFFSFKHSKNVIKTFMLLCFCGSGLQRSQSVVWYLLFQDRRGGVYIKVSQSSDTSYFRIGGVEVAYSEVSLQSGTQTKDWIKQSQTFSSANK